MNNVHLCFGQQVSSILGIPNTDFNGDDGRTILDCLTFVFETNYLRVIPQAETDEISIEVDNTDSLSSTSMIRIEQLEYLNGSKFSEYWECKNSRGYFDQILLGFQHLHPSISILCEGSALKVFSVIGV